jgi:hypothetical protein
MTTLRIPIALPPTTPRHLWVLGGLSLLWNAFGAFDYAMTQFRVESYMSNFTPEQLAYFYGFPWWADAAWAFGVWGALAGSVGLLLRQRWAVWAFGASLSGLVLSSVYTLVLTDGAEIMGGGGQVAFSVVIWIVAIALFVYARTMAHRGVLQ